ncbi:MAG: deoxyribose-phosphate aldolase [Candidatus Marinimicrobia bacterium]|nr:deoxyribose-phosphate aldolase [Candidatus Neomarinimicrobiota bacterium]MCF7921781.1 deoxyribose-phosphate aldolase [Candidatus Neomarinimicrobiota bacterium]
MIIALGADHGGYPLKEIIKKFLEKEGYQTIDCGTDSTEAVDYPVFAAKVARKVAAGDARFGVIVDGAGIGSSMAANKIAGVRAALCYDLSSANNAREHNDANVLTLGSGLIGSSLAQQIVKKFITTECTEERHLKRVSMINDLQTTKENNMETILKDQELGSLSDADILKIAERVGQIVQASAGNVSPQTQATPHHDHKDTDMVCRCGVCAEKQPDTYRKFMDFGVERLGVHDATGAASVPEDVARCIDHTLLKPDATEDDIRKLCAEADEFQFATVCISPSYVPLAAKELAHSKVKVCTVVGFPSGAHHPTIKAMETRRAIRDGAEEIDMVINIGALKSGNDELVYRDIRMVVEACEDGGAISKVIIEAALLTDDEKVRACTLAKKARADFVKTSTGFGPHGATAADVALMARTVANTGIGVKAAGGIRSFEDAQDMIKAGATRIGASAGIAIVKKARSITMSS